MLTNGNIAGIVRSMKQGDSTAYLAKQYGVFQRRVQQIAKKYSEQGRIPKLNPNRRPRTVPAADQKNAVEKAWNETRLDS